MTHEKRYRWHCIYDRIKDIENPVGAEIGVFRGECSGHLLEMHTGLKLYMIDMWSPDTYKGKGDDAATEPYRKLYQEHCDENFSHVKSIALQYPKRTETIKMPSVLASEIYENEFFDFVFIDGSHSYEDVKSDIIAWHKKVKPGGYLIFHDYGLFDGVTRAVQELFPSDAKHLNWPEMDSDYIAAVRV